MLRFTLSVMLGCLMSLAATSQVLEGRAAEAIIPGADVVRITEWSDVPNYIQLKPEARFVPQSFESWAEAVFNLPTEVDFQTNNSETDKLGWTHIRMQGVYSENGSGGRTWSIEQAVIMLHVHHGVVEAISGFFPRLPLTPGFTVGRDAARSVALGAVNARHYKWDVAEEEALLEAETGDPSSSYYPEGELVFAPSSLVTKEAVFSPAWKFNIYAHEPLSRQMVYVDAMSGEVMYAIDLIHTSDSTGTAVTAYSGNRTFTTDYTGSTFRLREAGRGNGIETYDLNAGTNYGAAVDFTDSDNFWNNVNAQQDEVATDAHWGAEMTYDYYWNQQGRNSIDDNGFLLRSYVHYSNGYNNAFWDGSRMTYGDGNGSVFTPLTTIDVCGHEITHGLTEFTAGLVYSYESGALNESFSDIFGTVIERYGRPTNWNYLIGEDMTPSGGGIRNMANPNQFGDPDTYLGTNWYTGTGDNGGVHTNSGVQNHWFYILSNGASGTNDNGDSYNVTGIGIYDAADIAFRSLTVYLSSNSQYDDARFYAIQAAVDLFGACSPEVIATTNAWYAVGVGGPWIDVVADFAGGPTATCTGDVSFSDNSTGPPTAWLWNFGDGNTSTQENPLHTYAQNGTYNVTLIVTGCNSNDTIIKNNYITVNRPDAPSTTSAAVCDQGSVTLTAAGSGGTLTWYDAPVGGNVVAIGSSFTTPTLTNTTSYYVEESTPSSPVKVGPVDNTFGTGGYFQFDNRWNYFDCFTPVNINSVKVYAGSAGNRTIQLRDNTGAVLQQTTVFVPVGQSRMTLNFSVPVGTDLRLTVSGTCDLYRNNSGPSYPYTAPGLMSITRSNVTATPYDYYYLFYDLEIQEAPCRSLRGVATATVNQTVQAVITPNGPTTFCGGGSVTLTANNVSYSWSTGSTAQSVVAITSGTYAVTTTDVNGCVSNASQQVTVKPNPVLVVSPDNAICAGASSGLTVSGATTYSWSPAGTLSCSTCATPTATPSSTTTYTVVGTTDGCTDTESVTVTVNQLPNVIGTSQDYALCLGQSTMFNSTGAASYVWSQEPGLSNYFAPNPVAFPNTTTTYTVTGTDANGCQASDTVLVTVYPLPQVDCPNGPSVSICTGQSIQLSAIGATSYLWQPGGMTGPTVTVSPVVTTAYTVTGTDVHGCQNSSVTMVMVNALPTVSAGPDVTICAGQSVPLSGNGAQQFSWDPATDLSCTGCASPIASPPLTTTYTLTGTDINGCENTDMVIVEVDTVPEVSATAGDSTLCSGASTQLTATGALTYSWTPSGSLSCSNCANPSTSTDTTVTYWVTATSAEGCTDQAAITITITPLPDAQVAPSVEFCAGQSAQLQATGGVAYSWAPSTGLSCSNCGNPVASPSTSTTYTVSVTDSLGCEASASSVVTVDPQPVATFNYTQNGMGVDFTNQSTDAITWDWDFGDGNSSTLEHPQHEYSANGSYIVTLIVTNGPCSDTVMQTIVVQADGISELTDIEVTVFPNPTSGVVTMTTNAGVNGHVRILNSVGQVIIAAAEAKPSMEFDLTGFAGGVYFVELRSEGVIVSRPVVKQ